MPDLDLEAGGLGDGPHFCHAVAIELGHDVGVGGVPGGEVCPVDVKGLSDVAGDDLLGGFWLLMMAVPTEPVVMVEDEYAAWAQQTANRA